MNGLRQVLGQQELVKQLEDRGLFLGEKDCGMISISGLGRDDGVETREVALSCDTGLQLGLEVRKSHQL